MDDKQIEELAKEMFFAAYPGGNWTKSAEDRWFPAARAARFRLREHFAAQPPKMTEERESEAVNVVADYMRQFDGRTDIDCGTEARRLLAKAGLIPPAPVKSPGERFAASFSGEPGRIAAKFDGAVGPLLKLAKNLLEFNKDDRSAREIEVEAEDALANFEAGLGGKP